MFRVLGPIILFPKSVDMVISQKNTFGGGKRRPIIWLVKDKAKM